MSQQRSDSPLKLTPSAKDSHMRSEEEVTDSAAMENGERIVSEVDEPPLEEFHTGEDALGPVTAKVR